jgi:hypothetical protein
MSQNLPFSFGESFGVGWQRKLGRRESDPGRLVRPVNQFQG